MPHDLDPEEVQWTCDACRILSLSGFKVDKYTCPKGYSFNFKNECGTHYGAIHQSPQLALMHACWSVLFRIQNPFHIQCPRFFIS